MWSHFAGSSDGNSTQHCDILTGELSGQRMCSSRRFFWRISQVAAVGFRREAVGAKNMKSLTIMHGFHQSGNGKPASGLRPQVIVGFVGAENMILP